MTKTKTIIISILLMASAIIIKVLNDSQPNNELIGFFSGLAFGTGIGILISQFSRKKTSNISKA